MAREFHTVGVVGLGTMGAGIVEVFAREGLSVIGVEPTEEALARGRSHLENSTGRALKRGKLSEADRDALIGRVTFTTAMDDLADVDLVVEAVPERLDLKQEVFAALDKICGPDTILATNTS
jgi:3-hydroxybutyryl-CoA dehydrogenase